MAELNLDEIQARAARASSGWYYEYDEDVLYADGVRVCAFWRHGRDPRRDGEFIAHAREDVPALVARIEELEAENAKLKVAVGHLSEVVDGHRTWLDDARAEADRLGDRCAELEGLLAEVLREPHPETGELQLSTGLRHRIRQALG